MGFIDNIAKFTKFSIFANILTQFCIITIIGKIKHSQQVFIILLVYTIYLLSTEDVFMKNASNLANFG